MADGGANVAANGGSEAANSADRAVTTGRTPGRVREWIRRYLAAELIGTATALAATGLVLAWWPHHLVVAAYAAAIGEGVGFYLGFIATRYVREPIAGSSPRRLLVIIAACVVEFGPAEIADTVLVRPAAMLLGSLGTGNVIVGVLVGKVVADVVFYGLAIASYEVVVRRLLARLAATARSRPGPVASIGNDPAGAGVERGRSVVVT